ncbi:hypothetical protein VR7878_00445 [Vibrio ruber DSM 16370]|uniref:Uncharacterized protein n=1 Tax=Vibrio ruber (strain DSM 16370 / JCM 11486 / BCRC 17186 / CECT 7878 / LMG 23124 / VR1) TaxID=1123498 RepID=A0A1R4LBP1_VIBR1|nr:hypothetical protein [Vibrio ruber]SJN53684.1 hypothetical protein VR7878_00445 [Vibrio ruber DSM 16370]
MKVLVQFDQNGKHRDHAWEAPISHTKGELLAVSPMLAVQLLKNHQAHLCLNESGEILFSA